MQKISIILLSVILLAVACQSEQDQLGKDVTIPVTVMEIKPGSIEKYVEFNGNVKPAKEVTIKSDISAIYMLQVNKNSGKSFALGNLVSEGTEIITLEDKEYQNNIKLESLKLNLEITKQVLDKQQSLYDKGGVTLSELKNAEIAYVNAKYSYDDALLRLDKLHVKAPFTGTIVDLPYYTPGVKIDAASVLVKLMDYSKLYLDINLPEKYMELIKIGQKVKITNYTFPNDTLSGAISQLSPAIDPDTRTFKGSVIIDNPKLLLRPGMYARGSIVIASGNNMLVLPKDIILTKQNGNVVFVIEKGIAMERNVQFGLDNPTSVEIISGLKANDRVVIKGFETLNNGSKVKIIK